MGSQALQDITQSALGIHMPGVIKSLIKICTLIPCMFYSYFMTEVRLEQVARLYAFYVNICVVCIARVCLTVLTCFALLHAGRTLNDTIFVPFLSSTISGSIQGPTASRYQQSCGKN